MEETLMCDNCNGINKVDLNDDYWETKEENTFQIYKCKDCGCVNSVTWANQHHFSSHISDKEDNEQFADCLE